MIVELVNTGSELILGRVLNTHQQWLCRQLSDLGYVVARQVTVADTAPAIEQAVSESLSRADLVITTGGLGPTSDDLTRDAIARLLGRSLREDAEVLLHLRNFFSRRQRSMPERIRVQARVPEGATVLPNQQGTAPGLAFHLNPNPCRRGGGHTLLIMLPGPTRELRPMFANAVIPLLRQSLPPPDRFVSHTLRTMGLAESLVQEQIGGPLSELGCAGVDLGYCARPGRVDVLLSARGDRAGQLLAEAEGIVRARLGAAVYGTGDEELEEVLIRLLRERKCSLAVAESCTGGSIANRLTNVPGASEVFRAGLVTYSNEAKQTFLGVRPDTLARFGAVSDAVALEMAEGARRAGQTDYAIAVTGIAGPTGGTEEKPVGTVFIAMAGPSGSQVQRMLNSWDRLTFKEVTVQQALDQLRLRLLAVG